MSATSLKSDWVSVYLGIPGDIYSSQCDEFIVEFVAPLIKKLLRHGVSDRAFFIRYSEGYPHIRLRVRTESTTMRSFVEREVRNMMRGSEVQMLKSAHDFAWVSYEPETDRYGSGPALESAEEFFFDSSTFALSVLEASILKTSEQRLATGLLATLVATLVFIGGNTQIKSFAQRYRNGYLTLVARRAGQAAFLNRSFESATERQPHIVPFMDEVVLAVRTGASLSPSLDAYVSALKRYKARTVEILNVEPIAIGNCRASEWTHAGQLLGSSMIHMTNNRLGLSVTQEAYMMFLLEAYLERASIENS